MATIDVKDATGSTVTIERPLAPGAAAAAASRPVALSNEDVARVGIVTETAPASDTASSGLNGRMQRVAQNLTTMIGRAVAQLGARTTAQSPAVNLASDDVIAGPVNETAPASDTASSGLNGRLQRIAQNLTTMMGRAVAQLGARTVAQSPAVNVATDDPMIGSKVTAITALATGGSGVIGWLSQIWNMLGSPTDAKSTSTDATAVTAMQVLKQISASQQTVATALNANGQAAPAASAPVVLPLTGYDVAVTITRPANTTAYTALDNVGGALTFTTMGPSGGAIMITGAQLELDISAIPSGMTSFRLHLYNVTPPSAVADNGAFDIPSGDRASYLGYIDLGTPVDLGSTCYIESANINKQIRLSSANLFGYLVTAAGYAPAANSEVYKVTLHAVAVY